MSKLTLADDIERVKEDLFSTRTEYYLAAERLARTLERWAEPCLGLDCLADGTKCDDCVIHEYLAEEHAQAVREQEGGE